MFMLDCWNGHLDTCCVVWCLAVRSAFRATRWNSESGVNCKNFLSVYYRCAKGQGHGGILCIYHWDADSYAAEELQWRTILCSVMILQKSRFDVLFCMDYQTRDRITMRTERVRVHAYACMNARNGQYGCISAPLRCLQYCVYRLALFVFII